MGGGTARAGRCHADRSRAANGARGGANRAGDDNSRAGWRDANLVGGPQPLPAVPRRARLPAPYRERARPQRSRLGTGAGAAERRPRLGAQHGEPALHRSAGPGQRALHPRQRQGKLPDPDRSSGHGSADRRGSGRRHLRLVVRRRRWSASLDLRLRRARQSAGALWPRHGCHRGRLRRTRGAAAGLDRDHGAGSLHRRPRRQHRLRRGQSGPRDRALRRRFLLPQLSEQRDHAVLPPEPRRVQGRTGLRSAGHAAELAAQQRAVAQFRLSPLAVQLPDPHRARARRAISAHRGHLSAARLHRRHDPRRADRPATRARMPADEIRRQLPGHGQRATGRIARRACGCEEASARPQARSDPAVDRRQRHQFFRTGRRRDRGYADRARAVQAKRRDGIGGRIRMRR